ncbi:hypothetical protein PIB30_102485, partial [Stylosanthes scabra]|nr:hypothetical protein [Stylosanthes scabra]
APPGKAQNFHANVRSLHRAKSQASEEHEVIALSSDSEHEKDRNLAADAEGALPAAEEGAEETLPKNNVYDALGQCYTLSRRMKLKKFLVNGTLIASLTIGER